MRQFNNAPWHPGVAYANTESEFMPTDTQESLERLCQTAEFRNYFAAQGWLEPGGITYKINSYGFRCDEFDDRDCLIALGCSFTLGIGLPVHATWPQLVAGRLGLVAYTLAWGGVSADTNFRWAEYWVPKLMPKAVFMLAPPPTRFELIRASGSPPVENYLPMSESHSTSEIDSFLKHWHLQEENYRLDYKKNKLAVKALCTDLGIPCFVYDSLTWMGKPREEIGYARDRMHGGPIGHAQIAERMLDDWSKKSA